MEVKTKTVVVRFKFVISMVTMYEYDWQEQNAKPWSGMVSKAVSPLCCYLPLSQTLLSRLDPS